MLFCEFRIIVKVKTDIIRVFLVTQPGVLINFLALSIFHQQELGMWSGM
jgi:hypothetical protein